MIGLALRGLWWSYWLGVAYWTGRYGAPASSPRLADWAWVLTWPVGLLYALVWAVPARRRWFCALVGHRASWGGPTAVRPGVVRYVSRCRRCTGVVWK